MSRTPLPLPNRFWATRFSRQGARAWELRTAIDLARLWADRGSPDEGRKLLQPILDQFVEGRDTTDPQTARRLLLQLDQNQ